MEVYATSRAYLQYCMFWPISPSPFRATTCIRYYPPALTYFYLPCTLSTNIAKITFRFALKALNIIPESIFQTYRHISWRNPVKTQVLNSYRNPPYFPSTIIDAGFLASIKMSFALGEVAMALIISYCNCLSLRPVLRMV